VLLHTYSEQSARNKLARHRGRGDDSQVMRLCDICGQWHVGDVDQLASGVCVKLLTGEAPA
jgi:hypothetical protein